MRREWRLSEVVLLEIVELVVVVLLRVGRRGSDAAACVVPVVELAVIDVVVEEATACDRGADMLLFILERKEATRL